MQKHKIHRMYFYFSDNIKAEMYSACFNPEAIFAAIQAHPQQPMSVETGVSAVAIHSNVGIGNQPHAHVICR